MSVLLLKQIIMFFAFAAPCPLWSCSCNTLPPPPPPPPPLEENQETQGERGCCIFGYLHGDNEAVLENTNILSFRLMLEIHFFFFISRTKSITSAECNPFNNVYEKYESFDAELILLFCP